MPKVSDQKLLFEEKLINLVKLYPSIYQKGHKDYKDSRKRENIFVEIAVTLKNLSTAQECETLWNSLKNQHVAFTNKLNQPTGSGNSKRPFFRHEGTMQFCKDALKTNSVISYSNVTEDDAPVNESQLDSTDEEIQPPLTNTASSSTTQFPIRTSKVTKDGNVKKRKLDPFEVKLLEVMSGEGEEDEFDLLGKSVALKLRRISKINPKDAAGLELNIQKLLLEFEMS